MLLSSKFFRNRFAASCFFFSLLFPVLESHAQGGSAVITLVMPVGARQLGMGETAVATSDDVFGTFWNPAGMAFGPLSNEWELVLPKVYTKNGIEQNHEFTVMATKPRSGCLLKSTVWAGAKDGLLLFNGKYWRDYFEYVLDQGDQIDKIVRRYAGTGDNLDSLIQRVKSFNHLKSKQDEEDLISLKLPYNLLFPHEAVTALTLDNTDRLWVGTTGGLYRFDGAGWKAFDKEAGFTLLTPAGADSMSVHVTDKVPETQALPVTDKPLVTDKLPTPSDSTKGKVAPLDSSKAKVAIADTAKASTPPIKATANPNEPTQSVKLAITALALKGSSIWIGTDQGLYEYKKSLITRRGQSLLPNQSITGIATHENQDEIYVSMKNAGIARYQAPKSSTTSAKWKLFTTTDGLIDSNVTHIVLDKYGHVWAAHTGGISHYSLRAWEKIHFKKQEVRSLALDEDGHIWIGTSEGAWKYTPNYTNPLGRLKEKKAAVDENLKQDIRADWVHFHNGNGLTDKNVMEVKAQGPDVWFVTDAGIERYNTAKSQVGFFYETLLPVLNLKDLYHAYMGATFPIEEWGTVGGFVNYVSFGQNQETNADGQNGRTFDSYEMVGALSYGTRLSKDLGFGLNTKFIYSALTKGITSTGEQTDGVAVSYAVDAGLLYKTPFAKGLSLAFVMQNIGPAVFYVDQAQADPIPFTWKVGMAYELVHTPNHKLTIAADANREAVYHDGNEPAPVYIGAWKSLIYPFDDKDHTWDETWGENLRQTVFNTGAEYVYANVAAFRTGYLYDESGKRYELDLGLGFMISDILQVDGTFIKTFSNGIRNNQKRFSMVLRF